MTLSGRQFAPIFPALEIAEYFPQNAYPEPLCSRLKVPGFEQ
jgi:hypothetical protein